MNTQSKKISTYFLITTFIFIVGSIVSSAWFLRKFFGVLAVSGGDTIGLPFTFYVNYGATSWDCSFLHVCGGHFFPLGVIGNILFIISAPSIVYLFRRFNK